MVGKRTTFLLVAGIIVATGGSGLIGVASAQHGGFGQTTITEHVGDTVYIQIHAGDNFVNNVRFKLGGEESQYVIEAKMPEGLSKLQQYKVAFNTSAAGNPNEKTLRIVNRNAKLTIVRETKLADPPINAGKYTMQVWFDGKKFGIGSVKLKQAPAPEIRDVGRSKQISRNSVLSTSFKTPKTVALKDVAVFKIHAPGTQSYIQERMEISKLEKGRAVHKNYGIYINIENSDLRGSEDALRENSAVVYRNRSSDMIYLAIRVNPFQSGLRPGKNTLKLVVENTNKYVPAVTESINFRVDQRKGKFFTGDNWRVDVTATEKQVIRGSTTVAPGTEIGVVLQRSDNPILFKRKTTTVDSTGNFSLTYDFSGYPIGKTAELTFDNLYGGAQIKFHENATKTPPGNVRTQEPPTDTPTPVTPATNTTTPTPTPTTPTDTPTPTPTPNNRGGLPPPPEPGFGFVASALAIGIVILVAGASLAIKSSSDAQ